MEIIVSQEYGKVPVGVIRVKGDLDASSYLDLVNTAQQLYDTGTRYMVLDLTDLAFISSAGLASLKIKCASSINNTNFGFSRSPSSGNMR